MLAMEGLVETTLGHVSLRVSDTHFLVRARRSTEHGLRFTTAEDIALADLDGNLHPGEPPIALPASAHPRGDARRSPGLHGRRARALAGRRGLHRR